MSTRLKGILHIGMPKCMSTSIQAYLREAENVFFAGIGPSKHVKPEILLAFQRHIVRTPSHFYDAEARGRFREKQEAGKGTGRTDLRAIGRNHSVSARLRARRHVLSGAADAVESRDAGGHHRSHDRAQA
jgi:hypothetical protein